MKLIKGFAIAIVIITLGYLVTLRYVDNQLAKRTVDLPFPSCQKAWSTRGLVTDSTRRLQQANSIEAVQLAVSLGAKGVEVDVYFDTDLGQYIVSHDRPYNLKNGELLTLERLLQQVEPSTYLWLDFKKLTRLATSDVMRAVDRLENIARATGMKEKLIIETEHPVKLAAFRDAGFMTLFDTQPLRASVFGASIILNLYKMLYFFYDFTVMGMNYGDLDDPIYAGAAETLLATVPVFIYHVPNEPRLIDRLSRLPSVQVVLNTDETSRYFVLPHCPAP